MTDFDGEHESALLDDRPAQAYPLVAWLLIVLVACGVVYFQQVRPAPVGAAEDDGAGFDVKELQARYLIGVKELFPMPGTDLLEQAKTGLDQGSFRERLRFVVLVGELAGPEKALEQLKHLATTAGRTADKDDRRLAGLLRKLYTAHVKKQFAGILAAEEDALLKKELGWFGELALAPNEADQEAHRLAVAPARRLASGLLGAAVGGCGLGMLGLVLLIVVLVMMYQRNGRRGFQPGSPHGGFYAETFAVWFALFTCILLGSEAIPAGKSRTLTVSLLSLTSLVALYWPVIRGVPWANVKEDLGLTVGTGIFFEAASGAICYVMCLPLLVLGVMGMFLLMLIFQVAGFGGGLPLAANNAGGFPVHPIVHQIRNADDWMLFQIVLAAALIAPILEEIFFRGVLFRHLREATRGAGPGLSLLLSALLCSFLFAVVHPQGMLAVPLLMSLAFGFSIGREWRGSLITCMVAHGINNGLVTLLAVTILRN